MYSGENKTARNSQKILADALIRLLQNRPYAEITISELCLESGISRQTFYTLFGTKENVLHYTILNHYEVPELFLSYNGKSLGRYLAQGFGRYVHDNQDFLLLLTRNGLMHIFYDCAVESLSKDMCLFEKVPEQKRLYLAVCIASTFTGVVTACLERNDSTDPHDLEQIFYELFSGEYFLRIM